MDEFSIELGVLLSPRQALNSTKLALTFRLDPLDRDVIISASPPGPLDQANRLTFSCHGFRSFDEAHAAGVALEQAVQIGGAAAAIGVDTGVDQSRESNQSGGRRTPGYRVIDERRGLRIWGGNLKPQSYMSGFGMVQLPEVDKFINSIRWAHEANVVLSERHRLALALYGLSHFESSERARFLVLVTCVEVLANREQRSVDELTVLDRPGSGGSRIRPWGE